MRTGNVLTLSPAAPLVKLSLRNPLSVTLTTLSALLFLCLCSHVHTQTTTPFPGLGTQAVPQTLLHFWPGCALVLLVLGGSFCVFQPPHFFQVPELLHPCSPLALAELTVPCKPQTAAISTISPVYTA